MPDEKHSLQIERNVIAAWEAASCDLIVCLEYKHLNINTKFGLNIISFLHYMYLFCTHPSSLYVIPLQNLGPQH